MKKIAFHLTLLLLCLSACGQNNNPAITALKADLAEANKQLPIQMGGFTMERMEIKGGDYTVYMTVDETQVDLDQYVSNLNQNKSNTFKLVAGGRPEFADLFVKSGLNLKFVVAGKQSKRIKQMFLSADEISLPSEPTNEARDFIVEMVNDMQGDLPEDWGDGLVLTSAYIEGDYVVYKVSIDGSYITIPLIKQAQAQGNDMKQSIIEGLNSEEDAYTIMFVRYLVQSGMGIKYIYWSKKSSDAVTVSVSPSEIKSQVRVREVYGN